MFCIKFKISHPFSRFYSNKPAGNFSEQTIVIKMKKCWNPNMKTPLKEKCKKRKCFALEFRYCEA